MLRVRKLGTILTVTVLLLAMMTSMVFAEGGQTSGRLDSVLIERQDGTVVSIPILEYLDLVDSKSGTLYDFLRDGKSYLKVHGVVSGEKYIAILEYLDAYDRNPGNLPAALESAEAIDVNTVATFMVVVNVNEETGEVELAPIGGEETPVVDKSALAAKITEAEALVEADYTAETWVTFVQALEAARTVNENEEATQTEVEDALDALTIAINALVPVSSDEPSIVATIKRGFGLPNFGSVSVQVNNLPDAAKFSVQYYTAGQAALLETPIVNIGQSTDSIFYNPDEYRTVTIKIFNGTDLENPIHVFEEVELIVIPFGQN